MPETIRCALASEISGPQSPVASCALGIIRDDGDRLEGIHVDGRDDSVPIVDIPNWLPVTAAMEPPRDGLTMYS